MDHARERAPWRRWGTAAAVLMVALAISSPAYGHGGDEGSEADVLVRQAVALIVNTPADTMAIMDKFADALGDEDTTTVDLKLVAKAKAALAGGDIHRARAYLEASIGARPHTLVGHLHPIRVTNGPLAKGEVQAAVDRATGGESGTNIAIDGLPADRSWDTGTWLALAALIAIIGSGVALSIRYRPPVPICDLKRPGSSEEEHGR